MGVWLWLSPQSRVTQEWPVGALQWPVTGTAMLLCWPDATQGSPGLPISEDEGQLWALCWGLRN